MSMGLTKTSKFSEKQNALATLAKALGHPARIAIIQYLAKQHSCVCGDIVEKLPLSQSTVSQHLKELKTAGLIKGTIDGPSVCYCINAESWKQAEQDFANLFAMFDSTFDCC